MNITCSKVEEFQNLIKTNRKVDYYPNLGYTKRARQVIRHSHQQWFDDDFVVIKVRFIDKSEKLITCDRRKGLFPFFKQVRSFE